MIFTIWLKFYSCVRRLIAIFNEQEMELFLSGLPYFNIDDLKAKFSVTSQHIVWYENSSVDSFRI
jgi:hypothetical protein